MKEADLAKLELTDQAEKRLGVVLFTNKFNLLSASLGLFVDPLQDLGSLALELLERLDAPDASASR